MPPLITIAVARAHIETDLVDAALQRLIDDADAEIVERFGSHVGNLTEELERGGFGRFIFPSRRVVGVVTLNEYALASEVATVLLAANDYRVLNNGRMLERLSSGTNPRTAWGERNVIVYSTTDQSARRTRVEIDLVRLASVYEAKKGERAGDYSAELLEYRKERDALLGVLRHSRVGFS
jgi:hypothetical protein